MLPYRGELIFCKVRVAAIEGSIGARHRQQCRLLPLERHGEVSHRVRLHRSLTSSEGESRSRESLEFGPRDRCRDF